MSVINVAPLAGSVDRNLVFGLRLVPVCVAPLAGSVDRNCKRPLGVVTMARRSPRGERG